MRSPALRRFLLAGGVALALVVLDQLTKRLAEASFAENPVQVIPGVLTFTFTENPGASFSLFRGAGSLLAIAALVAVAIIVAALREARPLPEVVGLGLIGGGAIGNLVDRVVRGEGLLDGHVIDWIQLPNFPVFNLADSGITVGVALLIISAWRNR